MKVLLLCNKSPYPPKEGGPIAMNAIIEGLIKEGHQVKVFTIDSWKYPVEIKKIPEEYLRKTGFETVYIDLKIKVFQAFINLFTGRSYHVERFISKDYKKKLINILRNEKFDIIQLETLYISPYIEIIREYSDAKIVLRAHNIEHIIWKKISDSCRNPLKKLYLRHLTNTLKYYEMSVMNKYDGIATISSIDSDFFRNSGCKIPVTTIAFGIDLSNLADVSGESEFPGFFHIGSMNWIPNQDGIKWFLDKVWGKIHSHHPELKLYLAGRNMPGWLLNSRYPNVEIVGEVDNAHEFINSKSIMIVPLFSGSGIRIKIIEGMALGKTIISTKIGADGIMYTEDENILIANSTDEFLSAIEKCLKNKSYCDGIGRNAQDLIQNQHNNSKITQNLISFYQKLTDNMK